MVRPYLCRVDWGAGQAPRLKQYGEWEKNGIEQLSHIAYAMRRDRSGPLPELLSGIPDIWAHVHLFYQAWVSDNHPLHERMVGQWRGLLATVALRNIKNYPLDVVPIPLARPAATSPFLTAAHWQMPEWLFSNNQIHQRSGATELPH